MWSVWVVAFTFVGSARQRMMIVAIYVADFLGSQEKCWLKKKRGKLDRRVSSVAFTGLIG